MLPQLVEDQVAKTVSALLPDMMQRLANWQAGGGIGPIPVPSMVCSNSGIAAALVTDAPTPALLVTPAANTAVASADVMLTPPSMIEQPGIIIMHPYSQTR